MKVRPLKPCGTPAAYRRHLRKGEEPCKPCRKAQAEDVARYQTPAPPRELRPCGTPAAYKRHLLRGEIACDACLAAHALEERLRYRRKRRDAA